MKITSLCSRNEFLPLHSTDFSEALLEAHETEVARLKTYYEVNNNYELKTYYEINTSRVQNLLRCINVRSLELLSTKDKTNLVFTEVGINDELKVI